jgi:hypothetical protein
MRERWQCWNTGCWDIGCWNIGCRDIGCWNNGCWIIGYLKDQRRRVVRYLALVHVGLRRRRGRRLYAAPPKVQLCQWSRLSTCNITTTLRDYMRVLGGTELP